MTNSSFKGNKSAAVNPYAKKKSVISNPYAKKQQPSNNVTPKVKPALPTAKNAVNTSNTQSYNHLNRTSGTTVKSMTRPVASSYNAKRSNNNPYSSANNNSTTTKAVTPTPKKKQIPHKHSRPGGSSTSRATATNTGSINTTRAADVSACTTPKATAATKAINRSVPNSKLNAPRKTMIQPNSNSSNNQNNTKRTTPSSTTTSTRPKSLKQSLKSQIAQIKRRKQLLIQQKEAEQQRKRRQLELQNLERQRQREARRALRQQQRQVVQETVGHIVTRVEQRMELEERFSGGGGSGTKVHYSIAEAMNDMIGNIEQKDLKEKKLIREQKARVRRLNKERKVVVRQCLSEVVDGVERRVYGVSYQQQQQVKMKMQQQQQMKMQQQQQQVQIMKMQQQQQQQQYNHPSIIPSSMQYLQQQGMTMPHYGTYYPMQMPMPVNTINSYSMPMPMPMPATHHYLHPNNMSLSYPHHPPPALPPSSHPLTNPIITPAAVTVKPPAAATTNTKKPLILSAKALLTNNPHSPYKSTHHLLLTGHDDVCVVKKEVKDSFGVTLRFDSKSVLVPRELVPTPVTAATATNVTAANTVTVGVGTVPTTATTTGKKPRRKRETFGVLTVVEASKAKFASSSSSQSQPNNTEVLQLQPGDIILSINGRDVGGMTFAESCRFISTSSAMCLVTGEIRCVLTVARRRNVPLPSPAAAVVVGGTLSGTNTYNNSNNNNNLRLPHSDAVMQPTPTTIPLISFSINGEKVIGDFSSVEWCAVVRAISIVSRALATGMALLPVATKDVCAAIKAKDEYKPFLNQRSVESMEAKMSFEGKRIEEEEKEKAEGYWKSAWEGEMNRDADNENNSLVQNYLTDAQRSILRSKARPTSGCKCGSKTHTFVSDPKCVLFRDVKQFCAQNSINNVEDEKKKKGKKISTKGKGKLEAAYIRRFNQLREETAATKEEAEFVLKMEQNQCFGMKKAVFAPSSLCTVVLSAVAAVMDRIPKDRLLDPVELEMEDKMSIASKPDVDESKKQVDSDEDDSDDEDMPLTALLKPQTPLKRLANNDSKLPSPKRPKQTESSIGQKSKAVPSTYILGEILLHISKTYGHLFLEPSHPNYAWQQRHRSTITTPLPKEVMFAGNPRKPGALSFENIRFMLTEGRLARLKKNWLGHDELKLPPQPTSEEMEQWNDEWTVTHLSSDAVTGIRHEIDLLENLGILRINQNGSVVLAHGWQKRIPHMILNEMRDAWGPDMDVNNLYCIHENIKSSLDDVWEYDEDEWRYESDSLNDDDDVVYEDEEYELRKQIFLENYDTFVNSRKGVGEFGI